VAPGEVFIFAAIEGKLGSATVTVRSAPAPVASVTVTPNPATVEAGKTVQLTATLRDADKNELTGRTVTWASSNILRATVSSTGLVTGILKGTSVTITATSEGKRGTSSVTIQ
jgi:uncharacterized protein YjdB